MTEYFYSTPADRAPAHYAFGTFFWHFRGVPRRLAGASVVLLWVVIFLLSWSPQAAGQEDESSEDNLIELSLDELLNVEIMSVAKKSQKRTEAAAAIYVLTEEDIRRSGATNIPDLLRTVPGLSVARIDANKWSVTSRGSAGRVANKLLVLIDGRSIYTPFFSGVYWEANDVMLEDVARIEIIRGPGGTLWGVEVAVDYTPKPWWLVRLSYTFFEFEVVNAQVGNTAEADTPHHQVAIQNRLDLPHNVEFDTTLRFVDGLRDIDIDNYFTLDARLAWHPREDLEFSIVGQNLLDSERNEFLEMVLRPVSTGLQRSVCGKVT